MLKKQNVLKCQWEAKMGLSCVLFPQVARKYVIFTMSQELWQGVISNGCYAKNDGYKRYCVQLD